MEMANEATSAVKAITTIMTRIKANPERAEVVSFLFSLAPKAFGAALRDTVQFAFNIDGLPVRIFIDGHC
jgi:hypothetical protein